MAYTNLKGTNCYLQRFETLQITSFLFHADKATLTEGPTSMILEQELLELLKSVKWVWAKLHNHLKNHHNAVKGSAHTFFNPHGLSYRQTNIPVYIKSEYEPRLGPQNNSATKSNTILKQLLK